MHNRIRPEFILELRSVWPGLPYPALLVIQCLVEPNSGRTCGTANWRQHSTATIRPRLLGLCLCRKLGKQRHAEAAAPSEEAVANANAASEAQPLQGVPDKEASDPPQQEEVREEDLKLIFESTGGKGKFITTMPSAQIDHSGWHLFEWAHSHISEIIVVTWDNSQKLKAGSFQR